LLRTFSYAVEPICRLCFSSGGRPSHVEWLNILSQEEARRASEIRYRRLFESAKDGILILDAETGMVVDMNPFLIELLGFSREAVLGKKIWELGFFKDIVANRDNFAELQQKEYIRCEDKPLEAADGRRVQVEFVSNVYLADHRKVIQCNIRDITERKRAEEALHASERNYRLLVESLPQRIFLKDRQCVYISCNENYARDLGIALRDIAGKTDDDFYPRELAEKYRADDRRVMETGVTEELEEPYVRDGKESWVHTVKTSVHNEAGECVGVLGVFWDITERKQAEAQRERLAALVEASPDFIGFADPKTTQIQYINKHGRRMCGIGEDEDVGKLKISDLHPAWMNKRMAEVVLPAAVRDGLWEGEGALLHRNGREIPVLVALLARKAANGEVDIFYTVSRDITARK
jgi:PAS domain S-box-containing protein